MDRPDKPQWLAWAQELQAIAQAGLEYSPDKFDRERFSRLRRIAVEMMSAHTGIGDERLTELFAGESGYQTPKIDVRAAVHSEGRVLFVKEADDNCWALPGGWAEINLSVRENVEKEVREEAGVDVRPERLIAVLDRNRYTNDVYPYSVYKIFVECTPIRGVFRPNIETSDARYFSENEVPELSELRNTREQVEMCYAFVKGRTSDVRFD